MARRSISVIDILCAASFLFVTECGAEICRGPQCFSSQARGRPCVGERCEVRADAAGSSSRQQASGRTAQIFSGYQTSHAQASHHQAQISAPLAPYTIVQSQRGGTGHVAATHTDGSRRTNSRTITAEVYHPGCAGGVCERGEVPTRQTSNDGATLCKGIECKLPVRMRHKPRPCVGVECGTTGEDGSAKSSPVHVTDRAAQFLSDFTDDESERSMSALGIQLTCDMKPGSNDVPPEDALVLHLQLSRGQESLVEALRSQSDEVRQLQRLLNDQQVALVSQQREILEQQRRMYEQMGEVKAQYHTLLESIKMASLLDLQGELESHVEALRGQVRNHHPQQAFAVHKVDMAASVMEVGRPLLACGGCGSEEYCALSVGGRLRCEKCTVCPAGFFLVAQCSVHADRICQDRDECLEISNLCGDKKKCVNTPGGFRCQGMTERDANSGVCGHGYFYAARAGECQACSECEGEPDAAPCTFTSDTTCSSSSSSTSPSSFSSSYSVTGGNGESALSLSWASDVSLPAGADHAPGHALTAGVRLRVRGGAAASVDGGVASAGEDGCLAMRQHGLVWLDGNLALSHSCRTFLQVSLRLNASDSAGSRDLSGARVEQRDHDGPALQSLSISGVAEVAPGDALSLLVRSAGQHCNRSGDQLLLRHDAASGATPLTLLWLSHDTGAVAMTAQTTAAAAAAHYHTSYRPALKATATSDAYVLGLAHDGRGVHFAEAGAVRFDFRQALYSMGQACVSEGFRLSAYRGRNGTAAELARSFRPGVHYRDASLSVSGAARVEPGDTLSFEVQSPAQCHVRYFADDAGGGASALSLLWVPAAVSATLSAAVARGAMPAGVVRDKPLLFRQTSPQVAQVGLLLGGGTGAEPRRDFVFRASGTASLALDMKLIHSCSTVKVTLRRRADGRAWERGAEGRGGGGAGGGRGGGAVPLAQQVAGQMPEGSQWAGLALRASFAVRNGTAVFFTLDCVRGRVNQVGHETGSAVSILWVAE